MRDSDPLQKIAFEIGKAELRVARMEKLVEQLRLRGIDVSTVEQLHRLMLETFGFQLRARTILEESRRRRAS